MEKIQDKIMEIIRRMDGAYEEYAKSVGMTYVSLSVLEEIYELGDGCTQKQISEETRYPKQMVNPVVKSFIEDGLITLREIPSDRRNKEITLTEKGKALCGKNIVPMLERESSALNDMGEEQSAELLRLMELYGDKYCSGIKSIAE